MKSWKVSVILLAICIISFVRAGGDTFPIDQSFEDSGLFPQRRFFDEEIDYNEQPLIYLPKCRLDENGQPSGVVTGSCDGRCRKTKIIFRAKSRNEQDGCCCINWDQHHI